MMPIPALRYTAATALATLAAAIVAGCSSTAPPPVARTALAPAASLPKSSDGETSAAPAQAVTLAANAHTSNATTPRAYRADAASHLYAANKQRIYKGKMPPLLYAIGVLQVEVDARGNVRSLSWMRAPTHAPEVVAEIERTVRAAAPFPAPARMGKVVYTDTWLWHKSGRFQLDTLTEGQL